MCMCAGCVYVCMCVCVCVCVECAYRVSTNTDVAVVTPLYETSSQCSQQVLVTSVWSVARREKTIVRAEEQGWV